jgi:hypothetical protein
MGKKIMETIFHQHKLPFCDAVDSRYYFNVNVNLDIQQKIGSG